MTDPSLQTLHELARQWSTASSITVRVHVESLLEAHEVVDAAKEWNLANGQPIHRIERNCEEYVVDEAESARAGYTFAYAVEPFVDFVFGPGVDGDVVVGLARIVTPWSLTEKPELVIEPKGMEA